ncbi:MAG: peptide/nickel transport system permease protein [Chloroflexota bacterium]|jgi:peptide/nickel transport system permease protein|nr:peptide/nickel transport system permease protein [Chloroflexota bacterium]
MTSLEEPTQRAELAAPQRLLKPMTDDDLRRPSRGFYARAWRTFRRDPVSLAASAVLGVIVLITLTAPAIAGLVLHSSPEEIMRTPDGRIAILQPPGPGYPLGTDDLGRDVLTRLMFAGQVSLTIGFLVAAISITVGTAAGLAAGYFGGRVDDVVNAMVQFIFNIPGLFVLILLATLLRPNVLVLSLIFGFFFWPGTARQVRGVALGVRALDYVMAARALGGSDLRIIARHLMPNVANVVMVTAGLDVAGAILGESALSFLGFGVQVPLASWGNMLSGSQELFRRAPWLVYPPGLMIFATVLSVVLLADGLRDAFDPRLQR